MANVNAKLSEQCTLFVKFNQRRLVIESKDGPRRRSDAAERIGLLVDFFSAAEISERFVEVLAAGRDGYADLRQAARRTIVENYDLNTICLLAQLHLPEKAINK